MFFFPNSLSFWFFTSQGFPPPIPSSYFIITLFLTVSRLKPSYIAIVLVQMEGGARDPHSPFQPALLWFWGVPNSTQPQSFPLDVQSPDGFSDFLQRLLLSFNCSLTHCNVSQQAPKLPDATPQQIFVSYWHFLQIFASLPCQVCLKKREESFLIFLVCQPTRQVQDYSQSCIKYLQIYQVHYLFLNLKNLKKMHWGKKAPCKQEKYSWLCIFCRLFAKKPLVGHPEWYPWSDIMRVPQPLLSLREHFAFPAKALIAAPSTAPAPVQGETLPAWVSSCCWDESLWRCQPLSGECRGIGASGLGKVVTWEGRIYEHTHVGFHAPGHKKGWRRAAALSPAWQTGLVYSSGAHTGHIPRRQAGAGAGRGLHSPTAPKADQAVTQWANTTERWSHDWTCCSNPGAPLCFPRGFSREGTAYTGRRMADNVCFLLI